MTYVFDYPNPALRPCGVEANDFSRALPPARTVPTAAATSLDALLALTAYATVHAPASSARIGRVAARIRTFDREWRTT